MNPLKSAKKILEIEIESLKTAANRLGDELIKATEIILSSPGRLIVCGMGKSGLVGKKISATFSSTGTPSFFLHPSEALHGDLGMVTESDVTLLLSNSGETEEIVKLIPYIRRIGAYIIAMTGNNESTLSKMSDVTINTWVSREACPINLAPTSSTTVTMALGDAIAGALIEARGFKEKDFARLHPSGSLGRKFLLVSDLMHTESKMPIASSDLTISQAVVAMSQGGFGSLIICKSDNQIEGLFTDGDLRRFFEKTSTPDLSQKISTVMTKNPLTITPDKLAMEALKVMEERSITSLPVAANNRLEGFLHLHDILKSRIV